MESMLQTDWVTILLFFFAAVVACSTDNIINIVILVPWDSTDKTIGTTLINPEHRQETEPNAQRTIKSLPGPRPLPIRLIGNLFQLPRSNDTIISKCFEWCEKYGPCCRVTVFGKDFVVIANAPLAKSVLHSNKLEHLTKSEVYNFMNELNGLAFTSGERWQHMQLLAAPAFHYKTIENRIRYSNVHADNLCNYIGECNYDKQLVELLIARCTVNIIIDSFVSGPGGYDEADSLDYLKTWHRYTEIITYRMTHPCLTIDIIWRHHYLHREMEDIVKKLNNFAGILIRSHLEGNIPSGDINEAYQNEYTLIPQLLKEKHPLDRIRTEVLTMLFGYEAFFFGIFYLIYMLAAHPEHQQKCREEVHRLLENQYDDTLEITPDQLHELKYIERCLFETLRMLPSAFIFGRKLECELELANGVVLPAGTNTLILPLVIHKMEEYFPNRDKFIPDRFLPENSLHRHLFSFIPFSAGPRGCMGMKSAIMSIKIIMAKILKAYTVSTTDAFEDIRFKVSLSMVPINGLDLHFTPRHNKKNNK